MTRQDGGATQTPIAVVGLACRLPGNCNSPHEFWKFLLDGGCASCEPPESRFSFAGHYDGSGRPLTMRSPGGMFINIDPKDLDAGFFALSQQDAVSMDPNQRQLMEVVYEGLENAGLSLEAIKHKAYGCFVGSYASDYSDIQNRDPENRTLAYTVGSGRAMLSNRISHFLDITGPSMTIDTACSGSLISVDLACRYLDSGDADGAIVAGCNLYMSPEHNMDQSAMLSAASPSGRCWTFDARADGYIKAEAINTIILKRLDDAIRDGDPIRAVIRGSSTNSDGWTPGIASPSADAQAAAIRRAYERAGISDFSETAFLECHGTGTLAGDPIETKAAASVFSQGRSAPLRIGAVKSNIGHSEPAAGISGVIKTVLAIDNGTIPGNPTFEIPNPNIDFEALRVLPSKNAVPWPQGMLKRASVNSFGYGGSNAHAILEHPNVLVPGYEAPDVSSYLAEEADFFASDDEDEEGPRRVYVFSANDEVSLKALSKAYIKHLSNPVVSVTSVDLAYTLSERRTRHFHRTYVVSNNTEFRESQFVYGKLRSSTPKIGFIFTGQGAQWPQMGCELIEAFPTAKRTVEQLDQALQGLAEPPPWSLLDELVQPRSPEHLRLPEFSQPLVTALQLTLVALLQEWGLQPEMVVGHSSGEIAAAAAAGLLTPEEAIKVAYFRGKASLAVPTRKLGMLAVGIGQADVQRYLDVFPLVKVACINSPKSVTLSGEVEQLEELEKNIKGDGHFARLLQVNLAYHSEYMREIAARDLEMLNENCGNLGSLPASQTVSFFSTVTGERMQISTDAEYWYSNMVCPVQFGQGLECMLQEGDADYLIELGPSGALAGPISQIKQSIGESIKAVDYSAALARGADSLRPLYELTGRMFMAGVDIDLCKVNRIGANDKPRVIIDLPNYQWNHTVKYWHESVASKDWRYRKFPVHDLLGTKVLGTSWHAPSWRRILRLKTVPWLRDHTIGSEILFPASGYIAMAVEAMFQTSKSLGLVPDSHGIKDVSYRLRNVRLLRALVLDEDTDHHLYLFLHAAQGPKDTWFQFSVHTMRDGAWTEHSNGLLRLVPHAARELGDPVQLRPLEYPTSARLWHKALHNAGFNFGPAFSNLLEIEAIPSQRSSRVRATWSYAGKTDAESKYPIHPTIIDSVFQAGVPPLYSGYRTGIDRVFVPNIIDEIFIPSHPELTASSMALADCAWIGVGRKDSIRNFSTNASLYDEKSTQLVFQMTGLRHNELEVDANVHKPHNYVRACWKPDVTLLTNASLDSLDLAASDTLTLEKELGLPKPAVETLSLIRHKMARLSILEVELGAAAADEDFQEWQRSSSPFFTRYVHVSSSSSSFSRAQDRLKHLPGTEFHIHDILRDKPLPFDPDPRFNLIIIKASTSSTATLSAVTVRLRPLGTPDSLILIVQWDTLTEGSESSADESTVNVSWEHADIQSVCIRSGLSVHLKSSVEVDSGSASHVFLCSANPPPYSHDFTIANFSDNAVCPSFIRDLNRQGWAGAVLDAAEAVNLLVDQSVVIIDDASSSFLVNIDEPRWEALKALLQSGRQLLYVSTGSQHRVMKPGNALFHGFARCIRREDPTLVIKTLDLESLSGENAALAISTVIATFYNEALNSEVEYCERKGVVHINRLLPDETLVQAEMEDHIGAELKMTWLHANPRTVRMRCERLGAMNSLNFYEVSDIEEELGDDFVEVEIRAAGLNFKEIATSMGLVPENEYALGCDGAGVIRRVGNKVKTRRVGDRVIVDCKGSFANRVQVEKERTLVVADDMTFEAAATLHTVYLTAIYAFMYEMQLRRGQSVLIHSAAGGVGIACMHLCKHLGAEIYATAGSEEKRRYLTERFGIPADRIFSSRSTDFGPAIKKATGGRGVDAVLNFLTGDLLDESWRCLADRGVLLEIGKKDIVDRNTLSMEPFNRNCSYRAIDISHPSLHHDLGLVARLFEDMDRLLKAGVIKPIEPIKVFSFAQIPDAMRYMRTGTHTGKIVISDGTKKDIQVPVRPAPRTLRMDPNGAYVIVGGLKGLCGSLALFLARHGAKELVVMSRSGASDNHSRGVIRDAAALGAHTTVSQGDVSRAEDVRRMFQTSPRPIKGIIQGAMVLRDRMFETMTVQDFYVPLKCKYDGTWNLHNAAQDMGLELDFFTLLSSLSGVMGHSGQANYSAGNVFLDAFAAYRHHLGLRAHTVDLGVIEEVGYFVNHQDTASRVESRSAFKGINERQLHKILKLSILQQTQGINPGSATRMITGLPLPLAADSPLLSDARFATLVPTQAASSASPDASGTNTNVAAFAQMVRAKLDTASLVKEAIKLVNTQLVKNLGLADDMEPGKSLSTYGIDSLAAVDLRNWLRVQVKAELTTLDILNAPNLLALCDKVVAAAVAGKEKNA